MTLSNLDILLQFFCMYFSFFFLFWFGFCFFKIAIWENSQITPRWTFCWGSSSGSVSGSEALGWEGPLTFELDSDWWQWLVSPSMEQDQGRTHLWSCFHGRCRYLSNGVLDAVALLSGIGSSNSRGWTLVILFLGPLFLLPCSSPASLCALNPVSKYQLSHSDLPVLQVSASLSAPALLFPLSHVYLPSVLILLFLLLHSLPDSSCILPHVLFFHPVPDFMFSMYYFPSSLHRFYFFAWDAEDWYLLAMWMSCCCWDKELL